MAPERDLHRLLRPSTVAVIGGDPAEQAIRQSDRLGFEGEIWPVHPTRRSMEGRRVYGSLDDLPGAPDAAFVAVNRLLTVEMVHELADIDCGGAVLYASGFAEAGPEGAELQDSLTSGHDMPLIGPNCYGIISAVNGAALWPDVQSCRRVEAGPALISQSGNISLNLTMNVRGVYFSYVLSLGNQASVTAEECLAHFAARPDVTAVGLYLESITDPLAFGRAALACHEGNTPVVVLKTGRTKRAERITSSHTAALSAPEAAYDALFNRYGVVIAESIPEFVTTLGVLDRVGPLPGNRLVSLSCSGGEAALVADRAVHHPVVFEPFAPDHAARVRDTLSELVAITNPLDYHTFIWGDEAALQRCFSEALSGPCDAAMLVLDWPADGHDDTAWWPTLRAFSAATAGSGTRGLVTPTLAENLPDRTREYAIGNGLAVAYSINEALAGLSAAASVGEWFQRPPPPLHLPPGPITAAPETLDEPTSKNLLASAGIRIPRGRVLGGRKADRGSDLPADLEFPLVAKLVGPPHKSLLGGVVTGIRTPTELAGAVDRLGSKGHRVLVEEQVTGGRAELLVSVRREAPIGMLITMGAGGALVELLAETVTLLLPITGPELLRALHGLRIGRLLEEASGADPTSVVRVVDRLTRLLDSRPDLIEVEINPLIFTHDAAWAVDALITAAPAPCTLRRP